MSRRAGAVAAVLAFFAACAIVVTWPQARVFGTQAVRHQDVYFNLWRLKWFAHALPRQPLGLFDTNVFYPELRTFALSDAMLIEDIVAAPLIWLGVRDMLVHNLLIFGAIVASGGAAFLLTWRLTRSRGAGLVAGLVFALAPYRIEHIMHMELQWAMWSPLALLALHYTIETGRMRWGIATGLFTALQMLSCVYYGVYLGTVLIVCGGLLLVATRAAAFDRSLRPLAAGMLLAAVVCGAYAVPYLRVRAATGERPTSEFAAFSAKPSSYVVATPDNRLYGERRPVGPERHLFPGLVAIGLALIGLLLRPPSRWQVVALIALVFAFEMSLGAGGYSYSFLYAHVSVFRGFRASARFAIFVLLFLGMLAGYGYAALVSQASRPVRVVVFGVIACLILAEYRVSPALTEYPRAAPDVYRFIKTLPRGVVAEVPFASPSQLPGDDPYYEYGSSFHFFPLVNGYSGVYPRSYLSRASVMQEFPNEASIEQLRRDGVAYVVVHEAGLKDSTITDSLARSAHFSKLGSFHDDSGPTQVLRFH